MSDIIRLDLTTKEAEALEATIRKAILQLSGVPVEALTVRCKLVKAQQNPLNGPTFAWARDAAIDAEDTARLDEEHEAFESIPEGEIPY